MTERPRNLRQPERMELGEGGLGAKRGWAKGGYRERGAHVLILECSVALMPRSLRTTTSKAPMRGYRAHPERALSAAVGTTAGFGAFFRAAAEATRPRF